MIIDRKDGVMVGEEHAARNHAGGAPADLERAARLRVPLALSSDDLSELTAALTSYMERQNFAAARD